MGVGGGLRRLNVLGLDLAWSDVDRGELREGYDVSISLSMSRSANLEKERGERGLIEQRYTTGMSNLGCKIWFYILDLMRKSFFSVSNMIFRLFF